MMLTLIQDNIMNNKAAYSLNISSSAEPSYIWGRGANLPTPRTDFTGTSLNEKVYIIGGFDNKGKNTDKVEFYNPEKDVWATAPPLPERLDHPAASSYNGSLFVVGGYIRSNGEKISSDKLFIYDHDTDKWHEGKSMPEGRGALTANFINGTLYAVGGVDDSGVTNSNAAYDPETNSWKEKAPMPTAREHLASAVVDGKLYVIGGRVGGLEHNLDVNEVYDPVSDSWTSLEPMPSKRGGLAAASSADGSIYVFGGEENAGTFNNNEKYNPYSDQWSVELPMPTARHGLSAVTLGDKIFVVGGGPEPGLIVGGVNEILKLGNSTNP